MKYKTNAREIDSLFEVWTTDGRAVAGGFSKGCAEAIVNELNCLTKDREEVEKLRAREKFLAETLCKIAGMGRYAPAGAEGPPNLPTCFEFWNIAETELWTWRKMVKDDKCSS